MPVKPTSSVAAWDAHHWLTYLDTSIDELGTSAKRFGAVGNGTTDDTAALQSVLNLGGVIRFPAGTYKVTATLIGSSNTTLLGFGQAKIILDTTANVDALLFANCTDIQIHGLEVDGKKSNKISATSTGRGIHIRECTNVTVADCHVHDTYEHGIRVGGGSDTDTTTSTDIVVRNNLVEDCGNAANARGWGIWFFWRVEDFVIENNIVNAAQAGGIGIDDASTGDPTGKECLRFTVTGNTVRDTAEVTGAGIFVAGSRDFAVNGNTVTGVMYGLQIEDGQGGEDTGLGAVSGNMIRATGCGVRIVDSRDIVVSGNNVELDGSSAVGEAAIKIEKGTTGAECTRIQIVGNKVLSDGVAIGSRMASGQDTVSDITIANNDLYYTGGATPDAQHAGIQLYSVERAIVRGNHVDGFYDGIHPDGNCTTPVIQDNVVANSERFGIRAGCAATLLIGNTTRGSGTSGFLFDSAARVASTVFANNTSTDTMFSGTIGGPTFLLPFAEVTSGTLQVTSASFTAGQATRLKLTKSFQGGFTAAPASGTWVAGDIVWNDTPTAGGFIGWVCVTGGTPGTWKTFGAISA